MKKFKRVFGSITNLTNDDSVSGAPPAAALSTSRRSVSGSIYGSSGSPQRGSYVSYDSQSLGSYNSNLSAGQTEVDPYNKQDKNFTKLHKWAYLGDVSKLKKFIKKVPVDAQDSEGKTALHHAASQGHGDAMLFLLGSKGNVEMKDNSGMTPFLRAVERCHMPVVQMLLQRRVDIQLTDYQGNTPAHLAARTGATDLLMLLLDCGCEYDDQNSLGRSPLHIASSENQQEAVEALLRNGASVNVKDKEGVTPLMVAAKIGSAPIVELLIENGADVSPVDSSKWSAADYARFTNHNQLHQRLKSLMHKGGSSSLFPQDLLNISDEGNSQEEEEEEEEGAVGGMKETGDTDEDGDDSWGDNSDIASIKEKPKINLTKFLPSSDESTDNIFSSTPKPGGITGPPKPPRLHASLSSLTSGPGDEEEKMSERKKEGNSDAEDSWKSSSEEEEPKRVLRSVNKNEERAEEEQNENENKDDPEAEDSWKSSSEEDEPKKKLFPLFQGEKESPKLRRDDILDNLKPREAQTAQPGLLADLGLDNMEFHSSEEVSFEDEDSMLPIEGTPTKVTVSRRNSNVFSDDKSGGEPTSFGGSPSSVSPREHATKQQPSSSIPKIPEDEASSDDWSDKEQDEQGSPSSTTPKAVLKTSPHRVSPKKSPSKRSPVKAKMVRKSSSIFDSDTDDEAVSPRRPPRRKSLTPTKKKFSPSSIESLQKSPDSMKGYASLSPTKNVKDDQKQGTSASPEAGNTKKGKENVKDILEKTKIESKLSDSSSGGSKKSLPAHAMSRTNSMSTVVGTLGREGTMQELEEIWEANASISPKKYHSSTSNLGSEGSPEHEMLGDESKLKAIQSKSKDEIDGQVRDEGYYNENKERKKSIQLEPESTSRDVSDDDLIASEIKKTGALSRESPVKMGRLATSSEVRASEGKGNVQSLKEKISVSLEESLTSPINTVRTPRQSSKEWQASPRNINDSDLQDKRLHSSGSIQSKDQPVTSTPQSRKGSRSGITHSNRLGSIVFSDEESTSLDPLATPRGIEEVDDVISAASTETEESAHINSGLKDSILTPLSSLPDANNINQLQDLVRELRLKLEKEFGRRAAVETKLSEMQQMEKKSKKYIEEQEDDIQCKQQEISSLLSKIKQFEYRIKCDEDSSKLKDQSLEEARSECAQLQEQFGHLRVHAQQQEELVDSLMGQLETKDRVNQILQTRVEELSTQTKFVSMKSCQTEEAYFSSEFTPGDFQTEEQKKSDADSQTVAISADVVDAAIQTEIEIIKDSQIEIKENLQTQQSKQIETSSLSTQTSSCRVLDAETQSEDHRNLEVVARGTQCVSETVVKSCQTQILMQSHLVQTDLSSASCDIQLKKIIKDTSCQTSVLGRQAAVQTDVQSLPSQSEATERQEGITSSISVQDVTSALEPILLNFTNDVKTMITDTYDTNQSSVLENVSQCLIREIQNVGSNLESSLQQASSMQNEDTQQKFTNAMHHIEESVRGQLETVAQLFQNKDKSNTGEIQDVLDRVNSSLLAQFEEVRNELNKVQRQRGMGEQEVVEKLDFSMRNLKESNEYTLKCLTDSIKASKDYNLNAIESLRDDLMPKFVEMRRTIMSSQAEDSGMSEGFSKDIADKLGKLERSLVSSFEKSLSSQDLSGIEHEVHKMSEDLQRRISSLQQGLQSDDSGAKLDLAEVDADLKSIRESNKQLMSLLKAKASESSVNMSEALEENFHILQDHLRRLQQTLMQRINEVSQHANLAEDQKLTWLSKQITEIATQVSGMQTGLMRMQSSLEASQSLPSSTGIIDETLISSLKASNEQAVSTLKFQNQSMIQLLESLQKDIHTIIHQKPVAKDTTQMQLLKDTLHSKEMELERIASNHESLQEKIRHQNSSLERLQQTDFHHQQKIEALTQQLKEAQHMIKEKDERIHEVALKTASQSDDSSRVRQENFRLNSENGKLSALLQAEQQQKQWYEGELHTLKESKEISESKLQELIQLLQMQRQQPPMLRTPPTGRDNDDDSLADKKKEIKKLEAEKQEAENQLNEQCKRAQSLELQLRELEADLGLERSAKADLEKQFKKAKENLKHLQIGLTEAAHNKESLQDLIDQKKELEVELKNSQDTIDTLKKKIENMNQEKLQLKQEVMMLKGEKLSFEMIRQEKDLAEQMQRKAEEQLLELQRKIPREYVPKATLLHVQAEVESKCQLALSNKLAELNQLIDQQSLQQNSQAKVKESQEQAMKSEIKRMSEEIIRLRAKLSVYTEEEDTWKTRHNRLMNLYQHELETNQNHIHKSSKSSKPKEESVSINLREINAHLQTPFASSTFLGQLTPPSSLHLPKQPSNIDSYHYTYSDTLDRTLNKYLSSADDRPRSSRTEEKPQARISPVQPIASWKRDELPTLDKSREDYVDLLRKKYGL